MSKKIIFNSDLVEQIDYSSIDIEAVSKFISNLKLKQLLSLTEKLAEDSNIPLSSLDGQVVATEVKKDEDEEESDQGGKVSVVIKEIKRENQMGLFKYLVKGGYVTNLINAKNQTKVLPYKLASDIPLDQGEEIKKQLLAIGITPELVKS